MQQGSLLQTWNKSNPTRIINFIYYKVWDEITNPFPNFNEQPLNHWSSGMGMKFHSTLYCLCHYLSMRGLKLVNVSKKCKRGTKSFGILKKWKFLSQGDRKLYQQIDEKPISYSNTNYSNVIYIIKTFNRRVLCAVQASVPFVET